CRFADYSLWCCSGGRKRVEPAEIISVLLAQDEPYRRGYDHGKHKPDDFAHSTLLSLFISSKLHVFACAVPNPHLFPAANRTPSAGGSRSSSLAACSERMEPIPIDHDSFHHLRLHAEI